MTPSPALVAYCRAGFEGEAGADLRRIAADADTGIELVAMPGAGFVIGSVPEPESVPLARALRRTPAIFARSIVVAQGPFVLAAGPAASAPSRSGPSRIDRVTPLLAAVAATATPPWRSLWIEFPDTNEGKELSPLARALAPRVEDALRARGQLHESAPTRLHVFLPDGGTAWVGTSAAARGGGDDRSAARGDDRSPARGENRSPAQGSWPMGIPRLRMPGGAPSRSTLKLAEAFAVFLGDDERTLLRPGLHAVDLGAAPGGWTWQLAQRGIRVTAVDNGPLKGAVAQDPLVTHVRDDAFRFRPRRPVDWLVCDVVESPLRVAELVARWIADGRARRAIFNLKLPMKKRYDEVRRCMQRIDEIVQVPHTLALRQLYHDREEVTGYLVRPDR